MNHNSDDSALAGDPSEEMSFDLSLHRGTFQFHAKGSIPLRGITAVFGQSGSGKTTFLRSIAGLEGRISGHLRLGSKIFQGQGARTLPPEERQLAYVFQQASLFPHLNVRENLLYAFKRAPPERRQNSIDDIVQRLGIEHLLHRRDTSLSGGERQRITIARALLSFPQVLLMDEPLAALDRPAKRQLLSVIAQLAQERSLPVLYVTHSVFEVARLADRVLRFHQGRSELSSVGQTLASLHQDSDGPHELLSRLEVERSGYDPVHKIAHYLFGTDTLMLPSRHSPERRARLLVRASDLSLSLSAPRDSSVLNALEVTIVRFEEVEPKTVIVHCQANGGQLVATITSLAFERLRLVVGQKCILQLKATALFNDHPS